MHNTKMSKKAILLNKELPSFVTQKTCTEANGSSTSCNAMQHMERMTMISEVVFPASR
jgi:hypothetical protein